MPSACIDTHGHFLPMAHWEAMVDHASRDEEFSRVFGFLLTADPSSKLRRLDDDRIAELDRAGIDVQVISLTPPAASFGSVGEAAARARVGNDELLLSAERYPGRFLVLASLPLPHVEQSLAEIDRVAAHPLLRGVFLISASDEWTLDMPGLEPLYARIVELGLPVVVHPALEKLPAAYADWGLSDSLAPVFSSSLGLLRLILSGMLDRVADLDVIVPHLGGTTPYLARRVADLSGTGDAEHDLLHYFRTRLYFDSCSYHRPALHCALDTVGADRVILGSDYPFRGSLDVCVEDVEKAELPDSTRAAIRGGTAARWFSPLSAGEHARA